jgi:CBS domain-containing protein
LTDLKLSLDEPVTKYMSKTVLYLPEASAVADAARLMRKDGIGAAIVTANEKPVGILTERDILYKVVAVGRDPRKTKVSEVMSSPIETVQSDSKAGDALAKMSRLRIRRLAVMRDGKILGLVVQRGIIAGSLGEGVLLPELLKPNEFRCPYCDQVMGSAETLSRHIDRLHIGAGLLQGDVTKW